MLNSPSKYLRTIIHLKKDQVFALLRKRLFGMRRVAGPWHYRIREVSGTYEFFFDINTFGPILFMSHNGDGSSIEAVRYNSQPLSALELYRLHYFDEITDSRIGPEDKMLTIHQWLDCVNPFSSPAWDPYPTSLRIVNWIKLARSGVNLDDRILKSLSLQLEHLSSNIEIDLMGNHLIANAKALIFGGLFFEHEKSKKYRKIGFNLLNQQLNEQILDDGAHFELSPMYQSIILVDLLDLIVECRLMYGILTNWEKIQLTKWEEKINPIYQWLRAFSHPDGKVAFFNDSNFSQKVETQDIERYMKSIGFVTEFETNKTVDFPVSGHTRLCKNGMVCLVKTCGILASYQPGHSHADTLSLELSIKGDRCIVNSGISTYEDNIKRHYQRGTTSHSTLDINGTNSSEVWASFRVGRRASVYDRIFLSNEVIDEITAVHSGYSHLNGCPVVSRRVSLYHKHLIVRDTVSSKKPQCATIRYFLAPSVKVEQVDRRCVSINVAKDCWVMLHCNFNISIVPSIFFANFGVEKQSNCIEISLPRMSRLVCETKICLS